MDIDARLCISYYQTIAVIDEAKHIFLAQHQKSRKLFVKKVLQVYNRSVYEYLRQYPIPYTPRIYALYEENNHLTVIEEYISGDSLEELLDGGRQFRTDEIKSIVLRLCNIVNAFHNASPQIIHRDIKPSNIIMTPSGDLYLLDFNAAKINARNGREEDTMLLGTKGYAAPEQYGFGTSNVQTDIYAIGRLMNTLVNGSFTNNTVLSHELSPIIEKCTRLNAAERYAGVHEIMTALTCQTENKKGRKPLPDWMKYLPPGYRTSEPFHMILATPVYLFVFWISLCLEVEGGTAPILWIERICTLLFFLGIIFCSSNYLDVQRFFPPCRTKNKFLKVLAILLLDVIVGISIIILMALLASLT